MRSERRVLHIFSRSLTTAVLVCASVFFLGSLGFALRAQRTALKKAPAGVTVSEIHYTDAGFEPANALVAEGASVTFVNDSTSTFWPASDPHPTHSDYPEFDSLKAVPPGGRWVMRFTKSGSFRYHDHLHPLRRGSLTAGGAESERTTDRAACAASAAPERCWGDVLLSVGGKSLPAALALVGELYREPSFADSCHDYLHRLGELAYQSGDSVDPGSAGNVCGYGFYHGYMEAMLTSSGDLKKSGQYCRGLPGPSAAACYHGLGHGATALGVTNGEVTPASVARSGVVTCQTALGAESAGELWRCASGVYMELGGYLATGQYNLVPNANDPFSICAQVNPAARMPCYTQQYQLLAVLGKGFKGALRYVESISDNETAVESVKTLSGSMVDYTSNELAPQVAACRSTQVRLRQGCLEGMQLSLLLNGEPGHENERAVDFCRTYLAGAELPGCYRAAVEFSRQNARGDGLCASIPTMYRSAACK